MGCFLVPAGEAVVTTVVTQIMKHQEKKSGTNVHTLEHDGCVHVSFARKLQWLSNMLWGGSILLAFEHVWHGEVVPFFPFLTAAENPSDMAALLHEMATAGAGMAVLVSVVWGGIAAVTGIMERSMKKNGQNSLNAAC